MLNKEKLNHAVDIILNSQKQNEAFPTVAGWTFANDSTTPRYYREEEKNVETSLYFYPSRNVQVLKCVPSNYGDHDMFILTFLADGTMKPPIHTIGESADQKVTLTPEDAEDILNSFAIALLSPQS